MTDAFEDFQVKMCQNAGLALWHTGGSGIPLFHGLFASIAVETKKAYLRENAEKPGTWSDEALLACDIVAKQMAMYTAALHHHNGAVLSPYRKNGE